ncbi:hypothetical protein [Rhizobium tubonense]|uniref:DUF945 domain-containing protein n=1 Tax=Rhizobium tubonense TaxID=484088 RepID=A0A2W4CV30_9HYPH|nr:hypothetical protein [Rhizobium tubonense]PZM14135.1 hypothetical protein CPY51_13025 [Rhizobium tubonense]
MRSNVFAAAAFFSLGLTVSSQAADVSEQGAKDLRGVLTQYLSRDLADSGFITVKPSTNRYEVTYDLSKFFDKISSSNFSIAGLKPLTMFAAPMDKGLWSIDGDNSLDISAHSKMGDAPATDISYSLASLVYTGVFDPGISYLRSLDVTAKDIKMSSKSAAQTVEATIAGMTSKLSTTDTGKPGKIDFLTSGTMPGFYEKITAPTVLPVEVRADAIDFNAKATNVPIRELRELVRFVFEHVKAKTLSKSGGDKFKALIRDALPLFGSLEETASANNLSVVTDKGNFGLKKLDYSFHMNGVTKASSIGFGMKADGFKLDAGMIPAGYEALVPDTTVIEVGIPDMNFAAAMDILLEADFSKAEPLSKAQTDRIGDVVFPKGSVTVDFPKIAATSGVYDFEVSGSVTGYPKQKDRYSLQASILARDYDKTIEFVQNAAKTDAQLNQVSFVMMMAKGFAKVDADGRQRWDVSVADDGTFTVNGQVIKAPK